VTSSDASGSTDHAGLRRERLDDRRTAGDQAATADRHEQHVQPVGLLQELEGSRPLPSHHLGVVVGMYEREAALGGERTHECLAVVAIAIEGEDLGTVAFGGGPLERGRVARHEDRRPRRADARGQRHGRRVVARGHRADAPLARRGIKR
jgi:hypothetical protein